MIEYNPYRHLKIEQGLGVGTDIVQEILPWCSEHDRQVVSSDGLVCATSVDRRRGWRWLPIKCRLEDPPQHWIDR